MVFPINLINTSMLCQSEIAKYVYENNMLPISYFEWYFLTIFLAGLMWTLTEYYITWDKLFFWHKPIVRSFAEGIIMVSSLAMLLISIFGGFKP